MHFLSLSPIHLRNQYIVFCLIIPLTMLQLIRTAVNRGTDQACQQSSGKDFVVRNSNATTYVGLSWSNDSLFTEN